MRIAFVRHGQTDWNAEGRLQGSQDVPLNDTGRQQALEAAHALSGTSWDAIVSSPLARARETAQIVAEQLRMPLGPGYELLTERDYGDAEGMTTAEARRRWPDTDYPGMEPIESVVFRGTAFLQQIADQYSGAHLLVVGHGTITRLTLDAIAGRTFEHIENGSVAIVEGHVGRWQVTTVNGVPVDAHP